MRRMVQEMTNQAGRIRIGLLSVAAIQKKNVPSKAANHVAVCSDDPWEQLKELIACLHITAEMVKLFTRCVRCNQNTHVVQRRSVKGRVPDYVWTSTKEFRMCPACRRIYWAGSHRERTRQRIEELFKTKTASKKKTSSPM